MMMTVVNRPILVRMGRSVRDRNNRGAGELPPVRDLNRQSCGTGAAPPPCIEDVGERLRLLFESLSASFAEAVEQAAQVFATLAEQLRGLHPDFVIVDERDPREHAVWLPQHRNTGQSSLRRPPRCTGAPSTMPARMRPTLRRRC